MTASFPSRQKVLRAVAAPLALALMLALAAPGGVSFAAPKKMPTNKLKTLPYNPHSSGAGNAPPKSKPSSASCLAKCKATVGGGAAAVMHGACYRACMAGQ